MLSFPHQGKRKETKIDFIAKPSAKIPSKQHAPFINCILVYPLQKLNTELILKNNYLFYLVLNVERESEEEDSDFGLHLF